MVNIVNDVPNTTTAAAAPSAWISEPKRGKKKNTNSALSVSATYTRSPGFFFFVGVFFFYLENNAYQILGGGD